MEYSGTYLYPQHQGMNALVATLVTVGDSTWYMDSGATNHITPDFNNLVISNEYKGQERVAVGNGHKIPISYIGSSMIRSSTIPHAHLTLDKMLYVPQITKNLLSIAQLTHDNNIIVEFDDAYCFVKDKTLRRTLLQEVLKDCLYQLTLPRVEHPKKFLNSASVNNTSVNIQIYSVSAN
ncbi:hypothetical protein ACOSQ4_014034 [Xanthoceras sorbifolium]